MQKSAKRHAFFSDRMCAVGGLEPKVTVARTLGLLGNVPKTWKLRHYCHCTPIRIRASSFTHQISISGFTGVAAIVLLFIYIYTICLYIYIYAIYLGKL